MVMERSANFSDEVTEGRTSCFAEKERHCRHSATWLRYGDHIIHLCYIKSGPQELSCFVRFWGPSIKYVTLEGVREGVTVCDRGRGQRACDVTLLIFLSYILNPKLKVMLNFLF